MRAANPNFFAALIESELFGHEKGAFTGASERKIGKFQYADGGTLFLDEIGDISPTMQVKLLRVLQEKKFTPVGSNRDISVDVRIIAASHKPFEEMIKDGRFREDLFYRLNVLPVYLPPLRERKSDVPYLLEYYINSFNKIHALNIKGLTPDAKDLLVNYKWPGNIRELRNVIEHAFIIESTDYITVGSLPDVVKHSMKPSEDDEEEEEERHDTLDIEDIKEEVFVENTSRVSETGQGELAQLSQLMNNILSGSQNLDFQIAKDLFEKEFIIYALKLNKGKINQTALKANIPKKTLLRKIEKYEIKPKEL